MLQKFTSLNKINLHCFNRKLVKKEKLKQIIYTIQKYLVFKWFFKHISLILTMD